MWRTNSKSAANMPYEKETEFGLPDNFHKWNVVQDAGTSLVEFTWKEAS